MRLICINSLSEIEFLEESGIKAKVSFFKFYPIHEFYSGIGMKWSLSYSPFKNYQDNFLLFLQSISSMQRSQNSLPSTPIKIGSTNTPKTIEKNEKKSTSPIPPSDDFFATFGV